MALTNTTLSAALGASDLQISVTSATGFAVGQICKIENEYTGKITAVAGAVLTVAGRGSQGTAAVAHNILAPISTSTDANDFPVTTPGNVVPTPPQGQGFVTYGANGAIALPEKSTTVVLTKATAATMTLANPDVAHNGVVLTIIAGTAAAHTVSNAAGSGFNGSGSSFDVATFGGGIGDSMIVEAAQGKWMQIVAARNVTLG